MTGDLDHVLLTRFSAVLSAGSPPASPEWLFYRLGFFYDACYPSVTRQRGAAPFSWLVLFDDRCPDDFREQVESLARGAFTPIWSHEVFRRDSFAEPVATSTGPDHAAHLVTTRLDSDDALAVDFMAAVQGQFAQQDRLFVNFTRGVQIDRTGAVYRSDTLSSPFLSLIERRHQDRLPDTVYVAKHARARAHGPIREVRGPVMWAQVVHDLNVSNIVNGAQVSPRVIGARFDFDLTYESDLRGRPLFRARAQQAARLGRLWAGHPGELTKFAEAKVWRLRGTHERTQDDGSTFSDRVQGLEHRWNGSSARRRLRGARETARGWPWRIKGALNSRAGQAVQVVSGDPQAVVSRSRVAVIAEYQKGRDLRPSAVNMAEALVDQGYACLIVAARDAGVAVRAPGSLPDDVAVVRRPNIAYDFGSWATALRLYPDLAKQPYVILTNDSLLGPFAPLDDVIERFESSGTDAWAVTESTVARPHLQSYFLGFQRGALSSAPLAGFFASIRQQNSKQDVIRNHEMGLSHLLDEEGYSISIGWTQADLGLPERHEPSMGGWLQLLDAGFPFVKRAVLTARHFAHHRHLVAPSVRRRYGVDLDVERSQQVTRASVSASPAPPPTNILGGQATSSTSSTARFREPECRTIADAGTNVPQKLEGRHNALNSLRLVLASAVIVSHAWPLGGHGGDPSLGGMTLGHWAVGGFFCISGYLIAASRSRLTFREFVRRRLARIMPGYWVCLVTTAFIIAPLGAYAAGESWVFRDAVRYVGSNAYLWINQWSIAQTLQGVPYPGPWNGSLWTLSFEFLAYLGWASSFYFPGFGDT